MKPEYLGDCLDFYKRWFLAEFFPGEQLAAIPMLTESWPTPADRALYSALVGVEVIQDAIVPDAAERADYFAGAAQPEFRPRDLFLDPDTGLRVGPKPRRRRYNEYLFGQELVDHLLPEGSRRVAVVYDQSISRGSEVESAELKLQALACLRLSAFAYCAQVAMVVVSRDRSRLVSLQQRASALAHLQQDRVLTHLVGV